MHTPGSVTRYAAVIRGLGFGLSAHAKDIWTIPDWEKREKLADAAFAVTCTAAGADHLRSLAPVPGRVRLAYHGLDLSRFPDPPDRARHAGPVRLVSVGRLVAKKGYDDLLDALAALPPDCDWQLRQIGGGPLQDRLSARAGRLGIAHRIAWLGKRDQTEVIAEMRAADLVELAPKVAGDGDRDGLPNVLMEAASQSLPIVVTAIAAVPEFIEDGVHGRLAPPGDPAALSGALVAAMRDPAGSARMAAAARARLVAEFGLDAGIAGLLSLLRAGLGEDAVRDAA
jgi:glycosyltransferase involved in cell wall biosynthesis